jgi:hypothetical protein
MGRGGGGIDTRQACLHSDTHAAAAAAPAAGDDDDDDGLGLLINYRWRFVITASSSRHHGIMTS